MDNKTEEVTEIEKDLDTAIAEEEAVVEETQEEQIDEVVETDSESEEVTLDEMDHAKKKKEVKKEMDHEDEEEDGEEDENEDEVEEGSYDKGKKKMVKASYGKKESKKVTKEDLNVDEHIDAMLSGDDLSEEFKDKAKTIFEAAVLEKVNEIKETLEKEYENDFAESVTEIRTELSEKVDEYLTYVAKEWLEENKLAVENGLKLEIMENFIKGLKTVFTENYIEVPESKVDLYAESVKELDEKKQNLDEEISKNMELAKSNQELQREISTRDVCEGLTLTQSEKVRSLSEGVDFVSVEDFGEKLQVIKDNYFPTESVVSVVNEETVAVEETTEESESTTSVSQTDPQVTAIAAAMGRFSKK